MLDHDLVVTHLSTADGSTNRFQQLKPRITPANVNVPLNFNGETLLHYVCSAHNYIDDPEMITWLVEERKANVDITNDFNQSPLHWAVLRLPKCAIALVRHGAQINWLDENGCSPLWWAIEHHYRNYAESENLVIGGWVVPFDKKIPKWSGNCWNVVHRLLNFTFRKVHLFQKVYWLCTMGDKMHGKLL